MAVGNTFHTSSSGSPYVSIFLSNPIFFTGEASRKVGESNSRLVNVPTGESKVGHTPETAMNKNSHSISRSIGLNLTDVLIVQSHLS